MNKSIKITAPAKINLTLDVVGKRADGYHEVKMVMQAIALADELTLYPQATGISLTTNRADLPADQTNLAYRAAALLISTFQIQCGIHIEIDKRIPMAAGLAGGSTDAAGVLSGLNQLWQLGLTIDELSVLGAKLGSDVPFCLYGGTMLATGRGEQLTRVPATPPCYVVLAKPPIDVATAWVYQNYRVDGCIVHPDTEGMIQCLEQGDLDGVAVRLGNALESVTIARHPEIARLKEQMLEYGAMASLMSGSGPTVFGIVSDRQRAELIGERLKQTTNAQIIVTTTLAGMDEAASVMRMG